LFSFVAGADRNRLTAIKEDTISNGNTSSETEMETDVTSDNLPVAPLSSRSTAKSISGSDDTDTFSITMDATEISQMFDDDDNDAVSDTCTNTSSESGLKADEVSKDLAPLTPSRPLSTIDGPSPDSDECDPSLTNMHVSDNTPLFDYAARSDARDSGLRQRKITSQTGVIN
jgi:hypothetical protein